MLTATTVTVSPVMGVYGGVADITAQLATSSGPLSGERVEFYLATTHLGSAITDNNGMASIAGASLASFHTGTYFNAAVVAFNGTGAYSSSAGLDDLSVTPVPLTVTANNQSKLYGAAPPTLTPSYTGFVNGDTPASLGSPPTLSTTATAASHVAGSPYAVNASGAVDSDYTISYVAGSLTVTTAPLSITANNQLNVYGAALPTLSASYTGFVNGDTAASLTTPPTLTTTATAASHVAGGPYAVTASGAVDTDYTISYFAGSLNVITAPLSITANNQVKTYGAALPALSASYTGFVNGDTQASLTALPTLGTAATAASHVAGNPYAVTASGAADADYTISYLAGSLNVITAPLTITADNQTKVYGAALPTLTASYAGLVNGDTTGNLATLPTLSTSATTTGDVSGNPYPIVAAGAADGDYAIGYVAGSLNVTPAPLTVAVNDFTKVYGQANPAFTGTITGILNGDDIVFHATSTAGPYSDVAGGPYAITFTQLTGAKVGDYAINAPGGLITPGSLTVTPAPLTVMVADQSKVYGQVNPTPTGATSGVLNGDDVSLVYATTAGPFSDVRPGGYAITASGLLGAKAGDYSFGVVGGSVTTGRLTIVPAPLAVVVHDATKVYGQTNPGFSGTVAGVLNGDDVAAGYATTATAASGVAGGPYAITVAGLSGTKAVDYAVTNSAPGGLAVTPAPLTVSAVGSSKTYGGANPAFIAAYDGFVLGEGPGALTGNLGFDTSATSASHVGSYAVSPSGLTSANYAIRPLGGSLGVTPAPLQVSALDATKVYGRAVPSLSASYAGFVNGDTSASLARPASLATTATAGSHVGTYPIVLGGVGSPDYTASYADGTLSVTPATLTVTADNSVKPFVGPLPPLRATYRGLVNGDTPASLARPVVLSTPATASSPAGFYPILASGGGAADYAIVDVGGSLEIQAPIPTPRDPGPSAFVASLYGDLTGRAPNASALDHYLSQLSQGVSGASVARQIYRSIGARTFRQQHHGHAISAAKALANAKRAQRLATTA